MIFNDHPIRGCGPERVLLAGSFDCNGALNPVVLRGREFGFTFNVVYTPTGIYTVTLPSGFTLPAQPASLQCTPQCDVFADWFETLFIGDTSLISTTRQFVIQTHRNGTAQQVAAGTGSRVNFMLHCSNNTGK